MALSESQNVTQEREPTVSPCEFRYAITTRSSEAKRFLLWQPSSRASSPVPDINIATAESKEVTTSRVLEKLEREAVGVESEEREANEQMKEVSLPPRLAFSSPRSFSDSNPFQ